jgi:thioredoxin reductase (NADPH)
MKNYDVIIIGGGPAGLTAGLYAARRNLSVLVVSKSLGGQMALAPSVENYPGIKAIHGIKLADKMKKQAKKFGCAFKDETVVELDLRGEVKKVKTSEHSYNSRPS